MNDRVLTPARSWAVVAVATATMALSYLDRQVLAVLAPTITAELEIGEEAYGWLQSAFSIAYLIGAPLAGWWLERASFRSPRLVCAGGSMPPGTLETKLGGQDHIATSRGALKRRAPLPRSPSSPGAAAATWPPAISPPLSPKGR